MNHSLGILDQVIRALGILKKDIKIYYAKGPVVLMGVLWPAFLFIAFAVGRRASLQALMPGLLAVSVFFTCSAIAPVVFPWETQARTLERLVAAPVAVWTILLGDMLASAVTGMVISIVPIALTLVVGASIVHPLLLAIAILLGSVCFSTLALILSYPPVASPAPIQMLGTLVKFPLLFISGVFVPLRQLPEWARMVAALSPLTYFTDVAQYATGGEHQYSIGINLLAMVVFTVVAWVVAVKLHTRTLPLRV